MAISESLKQTTLERGQWRVHVNPSPFSWECEVWLINRQGEKTFNATVENGRLKLDELREGVIQEQPLLRCPQEVLQLIVDAFSQTVPPTKKEVLDAELMATKYHLEDMRKLVFNKEETK